MILSHNTINCKNYPNYHTTMTITLISRLQHLYRNFAHSKIIRRRERQLIKVAMMGMYFVLYSSEYAQLRILKLIVMMIR
jgi:hypothetical protein